jgi:hypothetical protein
MHINDEVLRKNHLVCISCRWCLQYEKLGRGVGGGGGINQDPCIKTNKGTVA